MKLIYVIVLLTFFYYEALLSQDKGSVSGKIIDASSGEVLPGAIVRIGKLGAVSNEKGYYKVDHIPVGKHKVIVSFTSYRSKEVTLSVQKNETLVFNFRLSYHDIKSKEIEVISYQNKQEQNDTRTSVVRIESSQIKAMPGGAEDVLRSLQAMPGVGSASDLSSQIVVRGSSPANNLTIIDNIEFFSPYKLFGAFSVFNPDIVSNVNLMTAAFPAKYGDRLAAVVDVSNRAGTVSSFLKGSLSANTYYANALAEGKLPIGEGSSWILAFRRSYIEYISYPIARLIDPTYKNTADEIPNTTDIQAKLDFALSSEHLIQLSAILTSDALNADDVEKEQFETVDSLYTYNQTIIFGGGLTWFFLPKKSFIENTLSANVYYYNTDLFYRRDIVDINFPNVKNIETLISDGSASIAKYSIKNSLVMNGIENHTIEAGGGVDIFYNNINVLLDVNVAKAKALDFQFGQGADRTALIGDVNTQFYYWRAHAYIQDKISLFNERLFIEPGFRLDYYGLMNKTYVSPRFGFSFPITKKTVLRGGTGLFYQSPGYEKLINGSTFIDFTSIEPSSLHKLEAEHSIHGAVSIEHDIDRHWFFKTEVYIKSLHNLIAPKRETFQTYQASFLGGDPYKPNSWLTSNKKINRQKRTSTLINQESGLIYGLETFLIKKSSTETIQNLLDRLDGWISYSFSISSILDEKGNARLSDFDQTHTLSVMLSCRILRWMVIAAQFKLATGIPFTKLETTPRFTENGNLATGPNGKVLFDLVYEGNINQMRYPLYSRLDLRIIGLAQFFNANWMFYIDIINVYNNRNILKYEYAGTYKTDSSSYPVASRLIPVRMAPFIPGFGITAKF